MIIKENRLFPMIALGTVQFGMDYGITNARGKIPMKEIQTILNGAHAYGVQILDTAVQYGEAETILGKLGAGRLFRIVTKVRGNKEKINIDVWRSLQRLRIKKFEAVLLHDTTDIENVQEAWEGLMEQQEMNNTKYIGISIYYPQDWHRFLGICDKWGLKRPDIVQFPFSVFDQRFCCLKDEFSQYNIITHVRSVFLQGAAFMQPQNLPLHIHSLKNALQELSQIEEETGLSRAALLIGFALAHDFSQIIIGVDGVDTWQKNRMDIQKLSAVAIDVKRFSACQITDEKVLIPMFWQQTYRKNA